MKKYTLDEIAEMFERNENFHGTKANFEKIKLYHDVKRELEAFKEHCDEVLGVDVDDINVREKNAVLCMDFSSLTLLDKVESNTLASIIKQADRIVISAAEGYIRISFLIESIWEY